VLSLGELSFKQGNLCHVTGFFILEKTIEAHTLVRGVEVEKVEKVSAAAYKTAGQVRTSERIAVAFIRRS
jgi:hypothetical protein